jgi:membrane-associated phospholipid phosphatase
LKSIKSETNKVQQKQQRRYLVIIISLVVAALFFSIWALQSSRFPGDLSVSQWVQSFNSAVLRSAMKWVSLFFSGWPGAAIVIVSALVIWWRVGVFEALLVTLAGLVSLLEPVLKFLIDQPRPSSSLVQVFVNETGSGFPSGHAMFSILYLGTIAYVLYICFRKNSWRFFFLIIAAILALLVGFSRIFLGVHWLSQVIGGYLTGGILLTALIWLYNILTAGREKN